MLKKKTIFSSLIVVGILVVLLVLMVLLPNVGSAPKTDYLLIRRNASFEDVLDSLHKKESMICVLTFNITARAVGYPHKIKEGRYELKKGMSNLRLINNLLKGRQKPIRISFNNIRTKADLCSRLADQLMVDSTSLEKLLNDSVYLQSMGFNANTAVCMFIPNTYEVYWNIAPEKLIERMYKEYNGFWTDDRKAKAAAAGLQPNEAIALASIVEEESNMSSEKPTIAGLYLNRYHTGMLLQADPTIKFALGDFSIKRVLLKHIDECRNSLYNTYVYKGLPPGPIRIPSIESINAVLNYEKHSYFFMCAKGSGGMGHDFTKTFEEHKLNANRYRTQMDKLGIKE